MENRAKEPMEQSVVAKQSEQAAELLESRFLSPNQAHFSRTAGGFLNLTLGEDIYEQVHIYRIFPFSAPDDYLSVRERDGDNREIGIVEALTDFDDDTVAAICEQLALRYFTPVIQRVLEIKEMFGVSYWQVQTDKGECRFTCDQNGVAKLSDTRLLITDVDGNRFELPDVRTLSAKELRMVDLYM